MSQYHLSIPKTGSGPAVLVLHSFWGLTPFFKRLCGRLARNGYVALAPDMFDGQQVTVHSYPGTGHWFFERDRKDAFVPGAARLAWTRTLGFLDSNLPARAKRIGGQGSP